MFHLARLTLLTLVFLPIVSFAQIYSLAGTQSVFGSYHGELEVRPLHDGLREVTRIVEFDSYRFDGLHVQEVWQGFGQLENGVLSVKFSLRQADFLSNVDGETRTPNQFTENFELSYQLDLTTEPTSFTVPNAKYRENIAAELASFGNAPLWSDQRTVMESYGDSNPWISGVAFSTVFAPFLKRYHSDPVVQSSLQKPQCASKTQYVVRDTTDFDFLRAHPDTLRVTNKISDKISLTEASMRANAYGATLHAKASAFDANFPVKNLNSMGMYVWAQQNPDGTVKSQQPDGDSDLYTGMYAGSQAMRWIVTKDPVALANFKKATQGLMLAMDVTGEPGTFARFVEVTTPGERLTSDWRVGSGAFQNLKYLMPGNNDMIKGVFHAFAWAFEILPAGDPLLIQVANHARRLSELKSLRDSTVLTENHYLAYGLAALASGDTKDLIKFLALHYLQMEPMDYFDLSKGFYYGGVADWSGSNLRMVSMITRLIIAKNVSQKMGHSTLGADKSALKEARQNFMDAWAVYASAKRDALTVAAYTFGKSNNLGLSHDTEPTSWAKMSQWQSNVAGTIWSLREIPISNGPHTMTFDNRLRFDWCMSYWPSGAWQVFAYKNPIEYYYQSKSMYPYFEGLPLRTENLWKEAFEINGSGGWETQSGRVDFLHMYWMSRLGGLIDSDS